MKTGILLFLLIFSLGCLSNTEPFSGISTTEPPQQTLSNTTNLPNNSNPVITESELCIKEKVCIAIERAVTAVEHSRGLMNREFLEEYSGMLFVFEKSTQTGFWMKNTLIALDMIWVDENKKIVGITQAVPPCETLNCPTYHSPGPVKFVLEVNAGFSEQHSLQIGDELDFLD